jgi:hypothetical protein
LLASGTFMSSEIAFACGNHHSKFIRQTAAQTNDCGNGAMSSDINCQNLGNQINGDHNSASITGIRPSSSSEFDPGNANDQVSGPSISSSSPSSYIPSGNPITDADP